MNGIQFDDIHSYYDLNLVLSKVDIPPATAKTTFVDIPGADGSADLTEALGEVKFKDRTCKFTFTVFPYDDFEEKKKEVSNLLNGKRCKIIVDKDPDYYWIGRCAVNSYASNKNLHQIVVGATVAPYKYKHDETREIVYFCGKNILDIAKHKSNSVEEAYVENGVVYTKHTSYNGLAFKFDPILVNPENTYTLSYNVIGGDRIVIAFYDKSGNNISENASSIGTYLAAYSGRYADVGNGLTIKMSKDVVSIQIGLCAMNDVAENEYNQYSNIQLEIGGSVTAHEDYTPITTSEIVLQNSRKTVCPTIYCTDKVTVVVDGNSYALNAGTQTLLDFQLCEGKTAVSLTGNGAISFSYQEGDL